jgi:nucleotide-binding universal stress UspA family protein
MGKMRVFSQVGIFNTCSPISVMAKITASCLKPPLLLATNGSHSSRRMQALLDPIAQLLATPPQTETKVIQRPAAMILRDADQMQAGLIAVEMGSPATAIARYAACHVLVVRGNETKEFGWRQVLLVVDGSKAQQQMTLTGANAAAIALTRQLLPIGIEQVTILYIQPVLNTHHFFGPFATPTLSWQFNQTLQSVQQEQSQRLLQQAKTALGSDLGVTTLVQTSEPGLSICQMAAQQETSVIILGSDTAWQTVRQRITADQTHKSFAIPEFAIPASVRSRSPQFRQMRLTAIGNYVMHHAPCPVLLCRSAVPLAPTKVATQPQVKSRKWLTLRSRRSSAQPTT